VSLTDPGDGSWHLRWGEEIKRTLLLAMGLTRERVNVWIRNNLGEKTRKKKERKK